MKCFEIKKCPFNGTNPKKSKCPPHRLQIGCWEYDWVSFYKAMPDGEEKENWRKIMLEECPYCEVYKTNKSDIDKFLKGLKEITE